MKVSNYKVKFFYSYSHKDEELRECFENHMSGLKRKGVIEEWHDRKILPGEFWEKSINSNIENADLILFLVSSDFLASDYCYNKEVIKAVERHNNGLCKVVPVILRACDWEGTPFETIQGLPTDMKPIISRHWHDKDEAYTNVVRGIKKTINNIIDKKVKSDIIVDIVNEKEKADVFVTFRNSISGREVNVDLDKTMTFKEAMNELIKASFLDKINEYSFYSKSLNKEMDLNYSFMENNILDNDTIVVSIVTYAG
ncbi:MAG: toll/interleukin-1 receptor domain-containing protein [Chitinophagales bacterium]